MASKIGIFFGKMIAFLIQYTIGLVLPWWLIDIINNFIINGYSSKFTNFKKINRYTFGLILPWWTLLIFEGNKQSKTEGSISSNNKQTKDDVEKKWKCRTCGEIVTSKRYPGGNERTCFGNSRYPDGTIHLWQEVR